MRKGSLFCVVTTLFTLQSMATPMSTSEAQIRELVEKFRVSIINKDKEAFSSLFFDEDVPFIAVFSKEMLDKKRAHKPNYPSVVDFGKFGPPVTMLEGEEPQEEKMWNIKVQTDGYLGSVHFDYSDHESGIKKAWGTESWSLVKVGADWKITSVSFTVTEIENAQK
ncbi:hypothetical protein [Alteromonas sp. ASW11-130]|uniref:hypothetical protein n=1 Tax=Alteromonas sp. ASW11-130 TaxID=3015775 RepID=UPI00224247ED|nr:hypothetical protein [Alteromonas sp. ASW11-130]MCW8091861.1 hypothetical protein [Alteromonas sp. ASW11-130]